VNFRVHQLHGTERTNDWRVVHRSDAAYAVNRSEQGSVPRCFDIKYKTAPNSTQSCR
jgi:hypothetical protein